MDAVMKLVTLIWQIFLLVGPTTAAVQRFCDSTISIVTDFGTERLLVHSADILNVIMCLFGCDVDPEKPPEGQLLFKNALQISGWKHTWDNMLQKLLSSLQWFPTFLKILKVERV